MDDTEGGAGSQLVQDAQRAAAAAIKAAGVAAVALGYGMVALMVGMIAALMAAVALASRVIGEMLSHLAELIHGMIDAVVAMVPDLLRGAISVTALVCVWYAFNLAWSGYAQDMPSWLAAMLAAVIAVVPVAYGYYRHLWPWVLAMSLAVVGAAWALAQAGTMVRVGAVLAGLGIVVWRDVMRGEDKA